MAYPIDYTPPFRLITAGGRTFDDYDFFKEKLQARLTNHFIRLDDLVIVNGMAKGADNLGLRWARQNNVPVHEFPAQWDDWQGKPERQVGVTKTGHKYWKSAGPARNIEMAENADAVILFPGGTGTAHMYQTAQDYQLIIWDHRLEYPQPEPELVTKIKAHRRRIRRWTAK